MTQAEKIVRELRKGWRTWCALQHLWIQAPWKRLSEAGHKYLRPGERVERKLIRGLVHLRIVRK